MYELIRKLESINFEKRLAKLSKKLKGKKVIIYGSGILFDVMLKNYDFSKLNIIGISDLKITKQQEGSLMKGFKAIPLDSIKNYNPDFILIATQSYKAIQKDFQKNLFNSTSIQVLPLAKLPISFEIQEWLNKFHLERFNPLYKIRSEIASLRELMNICIDIKNIPPAKGGQRKIQLECAKLLEKVDSICKENDIQYWLDSGTLLGAYRHKGFVPWDDDIDICMKRSEYTKILPILKQVFENSEFYIRERAETCKYYQIRIINKRNSRIALDIFPVDEYYESNLTERECLIIDKRIKSARKLFDKKYPQKYLTAIETQNAKKEILKITKEHILENKEVSTQTPALFFGIDFLYRTKGALIMNNDMIFPLAEIDFEGKLYPCPNNVPKYLENEYGEYMKLPKNLNLKHILQ